MSDHSSSYRIAVVDDDHSVLQSLEYLLESADHTVHLFASAGAFLASGCLSQIDCVISDIDMPGMDGFELIPLVDAARPGLPIILITGHPDRLRRLPPLEMHNLRCFTKPFQGDELLAAVRDGILRTPKAR